MENSFGSFLKSKREKAGFSQKDVSTKLSYTTPQFVSNWERNVSLPPIKTLKKIGDIYKIPHDELFEIFLKSVLERISDEMKIEYYGAGRKNKKPVR